MRIGRTMRSKLCTVLQYIFWFISLFFSNIIFINNHCIVLDKANWREATPWLWNRKKRRPRTEYSTYSPWDQRFKDGRTIQMRVPMWRRRNLLTRIVRLQEKNLVIGTCNFAWERLDSPRKQFCFGSKVFELSVQMANFLELICTVKTCFFKSDWKKVIVFNPQNCLPKFSRLATPKVSVTTFSDYLILMETTFWTLKNFWWRWTSLSARTRDKNLNGLSGRL